MSIFFVNTQDAQISNAFLATLGAAPGSTYLAQVKTFGLVPSVQAMINATGSSTAAALSTKVATNLGLTGSALTGGTAYLSSVTFAGSSSAWAANLMETLNLFSTLQSDATYGSAATAYLARVNSAVSYSSVAGNNSTDLSTLAAAVGSAGSTGSGSTFTLTTDANVFNGGVGNDTFSGASGTIDGNVLNGGGGFDTLNITVSLVDDDLSAFQATGIERISIRSTGGTPNNADVIDIEMGDVTGVETLEFRRINDDITVTNLQSLDTEIRMSDNATLANVVVGFESSVVSGSSDTATITVDNSTGGADLDINGVETIAITVLGDDNDLNIDGDDLETVTITGAGELNMDVDASVTTVDASTNTGGVRVNFTAAADVTATGGSGNDTFSIGALLTVDDVIDGGDGIDTLILDNAGAALAAIPTGAQITNIEILRLEATDDSAIDAFTLNASRVSFDTIIIDVSDEADTYAITNYTDGIINIVESANNAIDLLDVSFADATGTADSLTVNVTNNDATVAFTVDDIASTGGGIETLRLVLNQGRDLADASDILVDDISIAADTLQIAGAADATLGADVAITVREIDASESTGDLIINLGAAVHDVTGGSGDDTFAFAGNLTSADTVDGGAGDDTITATLAAGVTAATITNVEAAILDFGVAGSTFSGANTDTNLTEVTVLAASDQAVSMTRLSAAVSTVNIELTAADGLTAAIGYNAGSNSAHNVVIGQAAADVDLGAVTVTGNTGALTISSVGTATNDVASFTANAATSLIIVSDVAFINEDVMVTQAALSVSLTTDGGAMTITGAQDFRRATSVNIDAADGNITLTGAMDATAATTLTVTATDDFEQTGDFGSDANIAVSLSAIGASASIRYNGLLDVDHATSIALTAAAGGSVVIDDIELLGIASGAAGADIDASLTLTATGEDAAGTESVVTVSAINTAAAATLDLITMVSDADGEINLTTGGAVLTVTLIDATNSLGTLVLDTSVVAAAVEIDLGAGTNTITTDLSFADVINLAFDAGTDTINVQGVATAADVVSDFEAGDGGDVISLDVSALNPGTVAVINGNGDTLSSVFRVSIQDSATGSAITLLDGTNIIRVTNTLADTTALIAALDVDVGGGNALDNEDFFVLWTDGASSYLAVATANGADLVAFNAAVNLVEFVGVALTDLTADNFVFV